MTVVRFSSLSTCMPRGSLATILTNEQKALENSLNSLRRFAVDAAKGMRFLHNLRSSTSSSP